MSQTPGKMEVTNIKLSKVQKSQKIVTTYRALQTDRKPNQNVKSPLMLLLLLKKKFKTRMQQSFLKIYMHKSKHNSRKIVTKYISSILNFKIKINQAIAVHKLQVNLRKKKNIKSFTMGLASWLNSKLKNNKLSAYVKIKNKYLTSQPQIKEQQPKIQLANRNPMRDSKAVTYNKKNEVNKSLQSGNKSLSASKQNLVRKLDFEKEDNLPADIQKIRKQNQQLTLMELSQEAREALKKVQRFDRFIYAQQTEKVCKDVLTNQLKRLQKIKNSQKEMRTQFYDNQLTITALFNHIKLISEMNRDLGDLSKMKQSYEKQQAKRKQQQFKSNLQNKRSKNKSVNLQTQIKQIIQNIQLNLSNKDYQRAKQDINTALAIYEKQQLMKQKIILYRALLQNINNFKDLQKGLEDVNKISQIYRNIDFTQFETSARLFKNGQKQFNQILNKYSKQQKAHQKQITNILQSYQVFNSNFIKHTQSLNIKMTDSKVKPVEQIKKSIKTQGNQIQTNLKNQYDNMIKTKKQFQKRVTQIIQKSQNKLDIKRDLDMLHKDKLFIQQKPYKDFFSLQQVIVANITQQNQKQIDNISSFIGLLIQSFKKQKIKSQIRTKQIAKIIQNLVKKNPNFTQFTKNIQDLIASVSKKIEQENQQQRTKRIKTETPAVDKSLSQQKRKSRVNSQQVQEIVKPQIPKPPVNKQKNELIKLKQQGEKKALQFKSQLDKQKQQKTKIQKQLSILKQNLSKSENIEKKIQQIIEKMRKNQEWVVQLENIKKDRILSQNKNIQIILNFYQNLNDQIKKNKTLPSKIQKCLGLILKLIQRKNLSEDKKTIEIQKIYDQTIKTDPHTQQILKFVIQWGKNIQTICSQSYIQQFKKDKKQDTKEQSQKRILDLSTQNKKLNDSIQTQRNKSKSLNQKIKQLEKSSRQQTIKISSLQKQKKQKQQSGKKPVIPQPKSQQTIKLQNQLKQSKQKIGTLEKQIQTLKNQKKQRQLSQKKAAKSQQNQNLKQQIIKLQNQLSKIRQKVAQNNIDKIKQQKQQTLKNQAQKSIATISITLEAKDYKQLQVEANKLSKTFEQDEKFSDLTSLIQYLIKILIDKENKQTTKKKLAETVSQPSNNQNKQKQKIQLLTKIIKQSQPQIKSGVYLTNNDYWDKFLIGADSRTTSVIRDLIRILKILTTQIKIKTQRVQQITQKNKSDSNLIDNSLQSLRNIQMEINKKQFLNSDQCWIMLETTLNFDDKVTKSIFKTIKKISETSRGKLDLDRKSSQKTIKSYEKQLQKLNNLISQYDIKLKEKDNEYQQLYKTFSDLQRQGQGDQRRSTSLRASRKSVRSNSSDKDKQAQIKNIKASMQAFAEQQRNMLEKLNASQNEKFILSQKITTLQRDLNSSFRTIEQLRSTIRNLQKTISDQHTNYQRQYKDWRQKSINNNKQINDLRSHYERQFEKKQEKLVQQFDSLTKQRQLALEKYHRDLVNVQNQLNNQIDLLREQLRQKNVDTNKLQQYEVIKKKSVQIQVEYLTMKTRLTEYETKTSVIEQEYLHLQHVLKQNGQLQVQIVNLTSKNRQLQFEITNLKKQLQIIKQTNNNLLQKSKTYQSPVKVLIEEQKITPQNNDHQVKILQLQQKIQKLNQQRDTIITNQVNLALQHQQKDFNNFLVTHDQQIQAHFFNIVIPQRIKQALQANRTNNIQQLTQTNVSVQKQLGDQIRNLREANRSLKQQYQYQYKITVQNQGKIDDQLIIIRDLQRKINQQSQKTRTIINELQQRDQRLKDNQITQQRIKKYLHTFQISWQEAASGVVSQNISRLYLKPQNNEPKIVEIVKQVVKIDPKQQIIINQMRIKIEQLVRINRDLQIKLNNQQVQKQKIMQTNLATINISQYKILQQKNKNLQYSLDDLNKKYTQEIQVNRNLENQLNATKRAEDELRHEIRRIQSAWQVKLYDQTRIYDMKILQLTQKPTSPTIPTKSLAQYRQLQGKFQDINRKYNDQIRQKAQWQKKYTQVSSMYQKKLVEIGNQGIHQTSVLNRQIGTLKQQNNQLTYRLNQKDKHIREIQDNYRKQLKDLQNTLNKKFNEQISQYQRKLNESNNQISYLRLKSQQSSTSSTIHLQCDSRYRQLQNKSFKQISDLKIKLNETSKSGRDEVDLLKQIISNQKIQLKQLQLMVNTLRQNKQQAQKQKQTYFNQLKSISTQKDRQIFKLRSQYQTKITTITIQKSTIQNKLKDSLQNYQPPQQLLNSRHFDNNNHLKIIQLQSIINTKNVQIKHLQQINERKRKQLDEQHNRLITIERQRQHLRLSSNNMQTHIMRLQSDISTLSNQLQKYKFALTQFQSRQAVLRSNVNRYQQQYDQQGRDNRNRDRDGSYQLKQQIGALKDQIIKITTTNAQQIQQLHIQQRQQFNNTRIKKILRDMEYHRSSQKYGGYDQGQLQLIKRINQQVTQLVATNRNLQTRLSLLQSQVKLGDRFGQKMDIFIILQDKIQILINFLLQKQLLNNTQDYSRFMYISKQFLNAQDTQGYFNNWLNFMRSLFITITELKAEELRHKAQEMIQLKQQMNQILDKHIQYAQDQNYQTLDKYKMIFSDIKILLAEYMNSRNEEYIQMIWRSLEPSTQHQG